jgi:hypothetical protein
MEFEIGAVNHFIQQVDGVIGTKGKHHIFNEPSAGDCDKHQNASGALNQSLVQLAA